MKKGKLASLDRFFHGDFARWLFLRATGDEEAASAAVRRLGQVPGFALFVAADCLQKNPLGAADDFESAIPHASRNEMWVRIARAHVVRDLPDGEWQVRQLAEELVYHPSGFAVRHALCVLCLVESPEGVCELAKSVPDPLLQGDEEGSLWNGGMCIRLLAGLESESQVLADAGDRQYARCLSHFTIGMLRLAERKRAEALTHFSLCVDTAAVGSFEYELARAYLTRLESDRAWPQWLTIATKDDRTAGGQ